MTIAVIPVRGRLPLLPYTIRHALKVVDRVICVVSENYEKEFCIGAEVTKVARAAPLGLKWNRGFRLAGSYDPDFILFVGSSDWVSDNWMIKMTRYAQDYDIVGVRGFSLLHLHYKIPKIGILELDRICSNETLYGSEASFQGYELRNWNGYTCKRTGEPIGIGRVLNRDFLKRIDYKPFQDDAHKSMDYSMISKTENYKIINADVRCLSISTNLWGNMHTLLDTTPVHEADFLKKWFPETSELMEWEFITLTSKELWSVANA